MLIMCLYITVVGGSLLFSTAQAHLEYQHAQHRLATVVAVDYKAWGHIIVAIPTGQSTIRATVDDASAAPDDLRPGLTVDVLVNSTDPHHVLLPSQLAWQNTLRQGGPAAIGVAGTALTWSGIFKRRSRRPLFAPSQA